jgi:hypothetical protein
MHVQQFNSEQEGINFIVNTEHEFRQIILQGIMTISYRL